MTCPLNTLIMQKDSTVISTLKNSDNTLRIDQDLIHKADTATTY